MAHLNKFSKIKEHILGKPALKLEGISKADLVEKNLDDFLLKFFTHYNVEINTVYASNGKLQTKHNLRRSMTDIFLICHFYFPKASLTKTYKRLCSLINNGIIVSSICDAINQRVYRKKINYDKSNFFNGCMTDEFGIQFDSFDLSGATFNQDGWGTDYGEDNLNIIHL